MLKDPKNVDPNDPAVKAFLADIELIKKGQMKKKNLPGALLKGMKALQDKP